MYEAEFSSDTGSIRGLLKLLFFSPLYFKGNGKILLLKKSNKHTKVSINC